MYHSLSYDNGNVHEQPLDVDAMLFDVSNRMARAQLARQISSSSSFRERASRVMKPSSVGNSPQNPQRRRTVTAQTTSRRRSDIYNQATPTPRPGAEPQAGHQSWSMSNVRPVSWHPSSMGINRSSGRATSARTSSYEPHTRSSMIGYQTVAMNGLPTPMTQPDLNANFPVDPYFSLDGSCIPYQQQITQQSQQSQQSQLPMTIPQGYDPAGLSLDTSYPSYVPSDSSYHLEFPTVPLSNDYPTCSLMSYATQTWAESLSAFPAYTAPPTPDFLPIQNPSDMWQGAPTAVQPRLTKPRSKELVGMGLYDTPDRNSFSPDSATDSHGGSFIADPHHESLGKGLKLEETWEPPAEEEEDDEDAESTDEEEKEEEEEQEVEEPSPVGAPEQLWQAEAVGAKVHDVGQRGYGDLSNQSFFFDGDDTAFDGPAMQSSLQGVALQDYMWV
ncbi:hypothetical protein MMC26_003382 [Xylographa opegraphella]|nr:hypothetical protein [Xylographa opegraphella]